MNVTSLLETLSTLKQNIFQTYKTLSTDESSYEYSEEIENWANTVYMPEYEKSLSNIAHPYLLKLSSKNAQQESVLTYQNSQKICQYGYQNNSYTNNINFSDSSSSFSDQISTISELNYLNETYNINKEYNCKTRPNYSKPFMDNSNFPDQMNATITNIALSQEPPTILAQEYISASAGSNLFNNTNIEIHVKIKRFMIWCLSVSKFILNMLKMLFIYVTKLFIIVYKKFKMLFNYVLKKLINKDEKKEESFGRINDEKHANLIAAVLKISALLLPWFFSLIFLSE